MGADLYRRYESGKKKGATVPILGFERSNKAVEAGYFRDAYNNGSILWKFGISWWNDICPLQNDEGIIELENVKKFRAMLDEHKQEFEENVAGHEHESYFREGAELLIKYLDDCIADEDSIEASL